MRRSRLVALLVVAGGLLFGFAGGEYGTLDWWILRTDVTEERAAIVRLDAEIDSLRATARALEQDPATQERVAREQFGMIRPGELLFRLEPGGER